MAEIKEQSKEKVKNRYVFPNWLADSMSKVSFRAQMESAILSMTLLVIGMILTVLYMVLYGNQPMYFKILLIVNMLCGIVFMGSYLITNYQQYKSFMDTMGIDSEHEKKQIKARGNIFKRIINAWKERKKAKASAKTIENIGNLLETSGMAKEISPEEKAIDNEIDDILAESLEVKKDDNKL